MKGQDQIIALRMNGMTPAQITFTDLSPVDRMTVQYEPKDRISEVDLRWCKGCTVLVDGTHNVVKTWAQALHQAGASKVYWHLFENNRTNDNFTPMLAMGDETGNLWTA